MLLRWNIFSLERTGCWTSNSLCVWCHSVLVRSRAGSQAAKSCSQLASSPPGRGRRSRRWRWWWSRPCPWPPPCLTTPANARGVLKQDLSAGSKRILINSCRSPTWSERARPLRQGRGVAGGGASGSALVQSPRLRVRSPGPTLLLLQPQEWLWYTYPTDYTRLASLYCTAPLTY